MGLKKSIWIRLLAFGIFAFLFVGLPILYGVVYPFSGLTPAREVFRTIGPLCVIAAAFGIFRVPFLVESIYRKWKEGLPAAPGFNIWWVAAGSILLIVSLVRTGSIIRSRMSEIVSQKAVRESIVGSVRDLPFQGQPVVTDVPGWLAYAERFNVIDLTGESTPEILACLDVDGSFNNEDLEAFLIERSPRSGVIWSADFDLVTELLPCTHLAYDGQLEGGRPRFCAFSASSAP